jgi:succinoglycan biosynthesis transport protein ExoP
VQAIKGNDRHFPLFRLHTVWAGSIYTMDIAGFLSVGTGSIQENIMDFWRTVEILGKRKWFILLSVVVATALTWGATQLVGSKWVATVQFVSPHSSPYVMAQDAVGDTQESSMDYTKQQAIIYTAIVKSRDVLEPALKQLDQTQLPSDLLRSLEFVAIAPRLFQLRVEDTSPQRAKLFANALSDNFVKVYHDVRTRQAEKTVKLLESQQQEAEAKLVKARKDYDLYRSEHQIVGTMNNNLDTALYQLREARQKQTEVRDRLADVQGRLQKVQDELVKVPATVSVMVPMPPSPLIAQHINDLADMDQQIAELRKRYTDDMPRVKKVLEARENLAKRLKAEQEKQVTVTMQQPNPAVTVYRTEETHLKQEVAGYQAQVGSIDAGVMKAQEEIKKYRGIDSPLAVLAGEVNTQLEARNNLAARLHNARMAYDVAEEMNPISVMDQVSSFNPPVNISKGRSTKLLLMAAMAALLATSGLVIGLDTIDRRLKTVKQAEIVLPAPLLTAVPQPMGEVSYAGLARVTELHPQSIHSEAYRFLGLHLLSRPNNGPRSLMVLSAKAEQGSTTTLTNLGITLAQAGKRVILVDANIRTPELHEVFGLSNKVGYVDLLRKPNTHTLEQALQPTTVEGLQVITSGRQPENPWQMFRSTSILEVSRRLHERADYVLYDTPSSIIFTDAMNLAPVVDAAYLCVRALEPLTGAEHRLVKLAEDANVPVLGCVLNDVPSSVVEGFDNYQHYYKPASNAHPTANAHVVVTDPPEGNMARVRPDRWIEMPTDEQNSDEHGSDDSDNVI